MVSLKRRLKIVDERDSGDLLKVAFATSDRQEVDQHFGAARNLSIYGVNPERQELLEVCEFNDLQPENEDSKLQEKLAVIEGCIAVYCRACGASAIKQLLEMGIQPVKVVEGALVEELLDALQVELRQGPSSWLARAISRQSSMPGMDDMRMGHWDE